jgi:hypothetical protein
MKCVKSPHLISKYQTKSSPGIITLRKRAAEVFLAYRPGCKIYVKYMFQLEKFKITTDSQS